MPTMMESEKDPDSIQNTEDISKPNLGHEKSKMVKIHRDHEMSTRTVKIPAFSYTCLELISDPPIKIELDNLTARSYLTASFTQLLGLTGSAISVDILKLDGNECWIRVPMEDLNAVIASVGDWVGKGQNETTIGWRVRMSGNWLGSLVGARTAEKMWTG